MKQLLKILRDYSNLLKESRRGVLATVVRVEGSAYRGPGARMLLDEQGGESGFLSGGCLEGDVRERAAEVAVSSKPHLERYDMTSPDDILWGLGMGCDGIVDVLLEPVPPRGGRPDVLRFLGGAIAERRPAVAALAYGREGLPLGSRVLLDASGRVRSDLPHGKARERIEKACHEAMDEGNSRQIELEVGSAAIPVLVEHVAPPQRLVVLGAGYDASPLVEIARQLGWSVTVVDHRPAMAKKGRFPEADHVLCLHPEEAAGELALDERTAVVVMTHNFPKDSDWLRLLLPSPAPYVGLLGPQTRKERVLEELAKKDFEPSEKQLERLYGPVGLDTGADTPEEIALSILAEVRTVLSGRRGSFLRNREGSINLRP